VPLSRKTAAVASAGVRQGERAGAAVVAGCVTR
jgi:threonine/homoserine/homoserine lactone efflux protein